MLWRKRKSKKKTRNKLLLYGIGIVLIIFGFGLLSTFRLNKLQLISPAPPQRILESIEKKRKDTQQETERLLQAENVSFSTVVAGQSSIIIKLDNGTDVLFSKNKDLSEQVSSLQGILSRLTMEGKKFVLLDLRFSKPIIQLE